MNRHGNRTAGAEGFALAELLVIIAVIAFIAGLLLPGIVEVTP